MSETVKLGKVIMTLGGDYNSSQAYDKLTCVYYDGSSWVSRKAVPAGVAPTAVNSAYWQKVSDRGAQGPQGQSYVDKTLVPIVNDLTTGGSSNVLAAEQGKVLDGKLTELSAEINGQTTQEFQFQTGVGVAPWATSYPFSIKKGNFSVRFVDEAGVLSVSGVALYAYDADGNTVLDGVNVPKTFAAKTATKDIVKIGLYVSGTSVQGTGSIYLEFDGEAIEKGIKKNVAMLDASVNVINAELATIKNDAQTSIKDIKSLYYVGGAINANEELDNIYASRSMFIPVKVGDVISSWIYRVKLYDRNRIYIGEDLTSSNGGKQIDYTITNDNCRYVRIVCLKGEENPILLNGESIIQKTLAEDVNTDIGGVYPFAAFNPNDIDGESAAAAPLGMQMRDALNESILGLWIKNANDTSDYHIGMLKYKAREELIGSDKYTYLLLIEKTKDGIIKEHILVNDIDSASILDDLQVYESKDFLLCIDWSKIADGTSISAGASKYNKLNDIVRKKNNSIALALLGQQGLSTTDSNLSLQSYIAMPIPSLAMVNVVSSSLPTSKTSDISAKLEFNGMNGCAFTKNIIINAQGNSSLGLAKKNFSIDIMDENYEDSHELKFGDWVAQDGFHLKSYMLDGIRVKPMAAYDIYESILKTRGLTKDRAWKRLQLPADIPATSNAISDSYLQIDDGAKNHPSGFPVIVFHNGVFYGIYCWQLKKHRANYHQEKKDAAHIHLDGNISNTLLWNANGVIDWDKWSGKTAEAADIANYDGIEIRNPKTLILADGTEYDGDTNRGELIGKNSASYDSSNKDMKRTAEVRESLENLSRRVYALTQMAKGAEKKSAIAEVFDVDSIIDYIIFGQIVANIDGYKKNWQWVTYDGIKWAVNAYDLDGTWGWSSWSYVNPLSYWLHNDTPPVTLIIENYLDEIKARYKELRDKGVIDLAKIMQPLVNYVKVIGIDYYDMEFEKWTDGARDNLWRFESWMEESIKRTDVLMGYNS